MDKKYIIGLTHTFREQLADVILDLKNFLVYDPDKLVTTNVSEWNGIAMFDSFARYINFSSITKIPLVSRIQKILGLINIRYIDRKKYISSDVLFANGGFLISNKPYITYLEKATQIFGYTAKNYNKPIGRWLLRNRLKDDNLKFVFFRTETAKIGFINTFSDDAVVKDMIIKKGVSVYPPAFPAEGSESLERFKNPTVVRFLFVSSSFLLKGGVELINAFDRLSKELRDIELTIITKIGTIDDSTLKIIKNHKQIVLIEPMSRDVLYSEYFLKSHCFVYPTYSDSFSMVINEAIGSFLPVITSDFFSIPERIIDGENGFLFKSPFKNYDDRFVIYEEHFSDDVNIIKKIYDAGNSGSLKYVEDFLYRKMKLLATDKDALLKMAQKTKSIYYQKLDRIANRKSVENFFLRAISE